MTTKIDGIKMLNKDVVITLKPKTEVANSLIYVKESIDESDIQFFIVLAKSDNVTMFEVGDTVVCSWKRITPPFDAMFKGEKIKVGITSEDEVLGVVED